MKIISYFSPFSKEFNSVRDYAKLSGGQKALTILATIGATLASLPFFGLGGVAVFRAMVEKYSFKKIDPNGSGGSKDEEVARNVHDVALSNDGSFVEIFFEEEAKFPGKTEEEPTEEGSPFEAPAAEKEEIGGAEEAEIIEVRRFATLDDGCVGVPHKTRKLLHNREIITIDEELNSKKEAAPVVAKEIELIKEVRGPEGKKEETEPKEVRVHLDVLSPDERDDIARKILCEVGKKKDGDKKFLKGAHKRFIGDVRKAIPKALELHEHFRSKFAGAEQVPVVDRKTGMACSTMFQLKTAMGIAQDNFPGLTTLTFNEEQRIAVARLIQVIMCGEEAIDLPLPNSSCCFQLLELQGKHSSAVQMSYVKPEENMSFLEYMMHTIESNSDKKPENEHLKSNIQHAAHLFVNDSIIRVLNIFKFGDVEIPLGMQGEKNNDDPAKFVEVMNEAYTKYLLENPGKTKEIVSANKKSKYLQKLRELFIDDEKSSVETSAMPEIVLVKLLNSEVRANSDDHKIVSTLNNLYLYSKMDGKIVREIAKNSGCDLRDVEPLVRIKLLELMILMNQSVMADGNAEIWKILTQYAVETSRVGVYPHAISNDFVLPASKESMSSDFNDIENKIIFGVRLLDSKEEGVKQCSYELDVAKVVVHDQLGKFSSSQGERSIIAMEGLCLSWLASTDILDFLVTQIDLEAVQQQPDVKYPNLKNAMEQAQKTLGQIAINAQPSLFENFVRRATDFNSLEDDAKTIDEIAVIYQEYLRVVSQIDVNESEVVEVVEGLKASLLSTVMRLQGLKKGHKNKNTDQEIESILEKIERLLSNMPESEQKVEREGPSYLDRLHGVFIESNNPEEVMWRVKKYESQILELRQIIQQVFPDVFGQKEEQELDGSWLVVASEPQSIVKELDNILNEVRIDLTDKERFNRKYLNEVRKNYNEKFLPRLRQAVMDEGDNSYVERICEVLFTQVSLEAQCMETIESFDKMGAGVLHQKVEEIDRDGPGRHEFVKRLHTLYKRVNSVPYSAKQPLLKQWRNSARGQWNYDFDPYRQGNPVHVLYQLLIGDKTVKALGMGTPTIEGRDGVARLAPEFIGFGRSYKRSKKKHLFILNQNSVPKEGIAAYVVNGDETARCDLILDAQEKEDLTGAIYAIALSKNSKFYSQKGPYGDNNNAAADFKKTLYGEVFVKKRRESGCYIPQGVRDSIKDFDTRAQAIINAIHKEIFNGASELNVEERRNFIELYYDHLTKFIIKELNVDSFNISCKDAIDRGAGSNAQLFSNCVIVSDEKGEISLGHRKKIEALMIARALFVRKRAPIHERHQRFAEGLDFSLSHVKGLKNLHTAVFGDLKIIPA